MMKKILFFCFCLTMSTLTLKAQYGTEILTTPSTDVYVYLGSLPVNDGGNYNKLKVSVLGGTWGSETAGETIFYISNRSSFVINQVTLGCYNSGYYTLHAYTNAGGGIDFYLSTVGFSAIAVSSCMLGQNSATKLITNTTSPNPPSGVTEITPLPIVYTLITDASGNIGMGTANPNGYKLAVKGNIHAQQVNVDLNFPAGDYVFESNYKLPDLTVLKTYLDKNHHLPEIPSANEMAKNGMNLGDMNELLLKKVEELTLYVIEKDRQLQAQQTEIKRIINISRRQQKQLNGIQFKTPRSTSKSIAK